VLENVRTACNNRAGGSVKVQFAQKAVIIEGDSILLVQKADDDPHNPSRWELPGGRLEERETIDEHLMREVWEESGLRVAPGRPLSIWSWNMDIDSSVVSVVAVARMCSLVSGNVTVENQTHGDFLAAARWVPLNTLQELEINPDQKPIIDEVVNSSRP
jgi:8-oxo-dGTP pyrophosphatase MutT (NUDIX family)